MIPDEQEGRDALGETHGIAVAICSASEGFKRRSAASRCIVCVPVSIGAAQQSTVVVEGGREDPCAKNSNIVVALRRVEHEGVAIVVAYRGYSVNYRPTAPSGYPVNSPPSRYVSQSKVFIRSYSVYPSSPICTARTRVPQ